RPSAPNSSTGSTSWPATTLARRQRRSFCSVSKTSSPTGECSTTTRSHARASRPATASTATSATTSQRHGLPGSKHAPEPSTPSKQKNAAPSDTASTTAAPTIASRSAPPISHPPTTNICHSRANAPLLPPNGKSPSSSSTTDAALQRVSLDLAEREQVRLDAACQDVISNGAKPGPIGPA